MGGVVVVWAGGGQSEMEERERGGVTQSGSRKRNGAIAADWSTRLIRSGRVSFSVSLFCLLFEFLSSSPGQNEGLPAHTGKHTHTHTHRLCHRPTRRVETSSDLANKRSINGAVKHVTQASQNLLRSNSPLQLPLHWSDPWATTSRRSGHAGGED